MQPFGWHLMLDLFNCDPPLIKDEKIVASFSKKLCELIDVKIVDEPVVKKFGSPNTIAYGITLLQLIETSALVVHFSDKTNSVYLDLFSCKLFDPEKVTEFVSQYFKAKNYKSKFTVRGEDAK